MLRWRHYPRRYRSPPFRSYVEKGFWLYAWIFAPFLLDGHHIAPVKWMPARYSSIEGAGAAISPVNQS
jgi:hypothetical protein